MSAMASSHGSRRFLMSSQKFYNPKPYKTIAARMSAPPGAPSTALVQIREMRHKADPGRPPETWVALVQSEAMEAWSR